MNKTTRKWLWIALSSLTTFFLMKNSFEFPFEFSFDLRQVPLILGCLYVGYPAAFLGVLSIFVFHYFLYSDLFLNPFAITLISIFAPFISQSFHELSLEKKMYTATSIAMGSAFITFLTAVPFTYLFKEMDTVLGFIFVQGATTSIGLVIMELIQFHRDEYKIKATHIKV
ncbi:LytS/YhcK type 5TM receptor domain-containing protein [Ammoniphilus resinae]|uniref:Integral membrane protein n=1 Tax=Ammoniphilus resinae TaxID=861532 RepID=A0ABS4GN33_9BACL|nr:LytS/YhcK type 5TM receptor domain-containing protein [Ammoniphilus resinae]MBP1931270.1 putative integral membrane protein [Ammoniphilus resinae]